MQEIRNSYSQPARLSIGNVAGGDVLVIVFVTSCVCTYVIFFSLQLLGFLCVSSCLAIYYPFFLSPLRICSVAVAVCGEEGSRQE